MLEYFNFFEKFREAIKPYLCVIKDEISKADIGAVGLHAGTASTFDSLPVKTFDGTDVNNGDIAYLLEESGDYVPGIYQMTTSGWSLVLEITSSEAINNLLQSIANEFYDTKDDFPATGEDGKLYLDKETNTLYYWDGTDYVLIGQQSIIVTEDPTADVFEERGRRLLINGETGTMYLLMDDGTIRECACFELGSSSQMITITLLGDNPLEIYAGQSLVDDGATAIDLNGVDMTQYIQTNFGDIDNNTVGTYYADYWVYDGAGNKILVQREVRVLECAELPVVTINPGNDTVALDETWVDAGATATACGMSIPVTVTGTIDTSFAGTDTITYSATSAAGTTEVTRTVTIEDSAPTLGCDTDICPNSAWGYAYTEDQNYVGVFNPGDFICSDDDLIDKSFDLVTNNEGRVSIRYGALFTVKHYRADGSLIGTDSNRISGCIVLENIINVFYQGEEVKSIKWSVENADTF